MKPVFVLIATLGVLPFWAQESHLPTFEEVISLHRYFSPRISPDGQHVVFQKRVTDWEDNSYRTQLWLSKHGDVPFPLTTHPTAGAWSAQWSPDSRWIAFLSDRQEKTQIFGIRISGGEAIQLSHEEESIQSFRWSPDGKQFALRMRKEDKDREARDDKYGVFDIEDDEFQLSYLYLLAFDPEARNPSELPCPDDSTATCLEWPKADILMDSVDYTVTGFEWSPDGNHIAFNHQPDPLINSFFKADISLIDLKDRQITTLVRHPSYDGFICWAPDGKSFLYSSSLEDSTSNYYKNTPIFVRPLEGPSRRLAADFDEELFGFEWRTTGIFARANLRTTTQLVELDMETDEVHVIDKGLHNLYSFTLSDDGSRIAYYGANPESLPEVYLGDLAGADDRRLTDATAQISNWKTADSEIIRWRSHDGAEIEGILHKPKDYDSTRQYPLLVLIHGGPTGIDRPAPLLTYVYPALQWLYKGALILRPNYRGSAGYGEEFRSLNVQNLGVGDAWDVLSGVDHLQSLGMIDTARMGAMGWSQGGYISAFLTTTTPRFKAISVGAGISDWITYYVNTDIHPFTRQYLKATPWEDEEVYRRTSPMSYINHASTPTLIQHGEFDRRVPIPNAYKLFQGLQDVGVDTRLIVYKGFGHGINKPKELLAANWHNWQWFLKYVWGEDVMLTVDP